jgi:hypothetical protein
MPEALEDIDDLPRVARLLTHLAKQGRIVCGQSDPETREVIIDQQRVRYRVEEEQIVVLSAELMTLH